MHSTNYTNTFICVAKDTSATRGVAPPERNKPTVAALSHELIADKPYRLTSDDLVFQIHAVRTGIPKSEWKSERAKYFEKGRPCLRCSPLPKTYGWGIHHDGRSRVALYGMESTEYRKLAAGKALKAGGSPVTVKYAMRSSR